MVLLAEAAKIGIAPLAFWDMTPREVLVALEAAVWQTEREQERMLALAWHTAYLQRVKTLPSLQSLLRSLQPDKGVPIAERRKEFAELRETYNAYRARRRTDSHTGDA